MPKFVIPSADKLIGEIRQMHNESRKNTVDMSCELIDEKVASRDRARRKAMELEWHDGRRANAKSPPIRRPSSRQTRTNATGKREDSGGFERITGLSHDRKRADSHIGEHSCVDSSYTNAGVRTVPGNYSTAVQTRSSQYSALPKVLYFISLFQLVIRVIVYATCIALTLVIAQYVT